MNLKSESDVHRFELVACTLALSDSCGRLEDIDGGRTSRKEEVVEKWLNGDNHSWRASTVRCEGSIDDSEAR